MSWFKITWMLFNHTRNNKKIEEWFYVGRNSVANLTWNILEKNWDYPIKSERAYTVVYGSRNSIRRHISRSIARREASSRTREPLVGPATRSNNIGSLIRNRESLSTEPSRNNSRRLIRRDHHLASRQSREPFRQREFPVSPRINNPSRDRIFFPLFFSLHRID